MRRTLKWEVHMPEDVPLVSRRLRELREAAGLSIRALAEKAGLHHMTIARTEWGRLPRMETVIRLAEALGVTVQALLSEPKPAPKRRGRPETK